jgi:hypothetical protein
LTRVRAGSPREFLRLRLWHRSVRPRALPTTRCCIHARPPRSGRSFSRRGTTTGASVDRFSSARDPGHPHPPGRWVRRAPAWEKPCGGFHARRSGDGAPGQGMPEDEIGASSARCGVRWDSPGDHEATGVPSATLRSTPLEDDWALHTFLTAAEKPNASRSWRSDLWRVRSYSRFGWFKCG